MHNRKIEENAALPAGRESPRAKRLFLFLSRKLRKSAKIVYNGLEIKNHITKERM